MPSLGFQRRWPPPPPPNCARSTTPPGIQNAICHRHQDRCSRGSHPHFGAPLVTTPPFSLCCTPKPLVVSWWRGRLGLRRFWPGFHAGQLLRNSLADVLNLPNSRFCRQTECGAESDNGTGPSQVLRIAKGPPASKASGAATTAPAATQVGLATIPGDAPTAVSGRWGCCASCCLPTWRV